MPSNVFSLLISSVWFFTSLFTFNLQQEGEIVLSLSRDFGYSSGTGKIQGTFSMKVSGPVSLSRVIFLVDGIQIGEDAEVPFKFQFRTENFELGIHTLQAIGFTSDGKELRSNEQRREFVSAEQGWKAAGKIVIPLVVIVIVAMLLSTLLPTVFGRGKKGTHPLGSPRNYGVLGGAICPKCSRPFSLHIYGLNLGLGKLDRCPHCGKWSIVRRSSMQALSEAEARELDMEAHAVTTTITSEEERLRKDLENTRYEDIVE
ncbi:MAG: hypothetical protein JSV61_07290 [Anaerolineales bacterium]|nr:MAG: hypothetical protein JSV61_07290 [Anaerolineales bacterium]